MTAAKRKLAVLASFSGEGGVERMILNLVDAFADIPDLSVDLVVLREDSRHLARLPPNVNLVRTGVRHSLLAVPAIRRYLRRERPDAMLVAKDRAGRAALMARAVSGVAIPIHIRLGTNLSEAMKEKSGLARWFRYQLIRALYPLADGIVAVSNGVADDVVLISGLPPARVVVIRNPVITPELAAKAAEAVAHPWLQSGQPPVVMGMGRLTRQKDFPSLVRAFAQVRQQQDVRLIILGEGRDRAELELLCHELGIADDVAFPGFISNPYPWLARAQLFVLSSAWEGSPNALTEAMALGVPSVSTDCPSGPMEILAGGNYGPLVPVGDVDALAAAMLRTLASPPAPERLREAVAEYESGACARSYLTRIGLADVLN